MQTGLEVFVNNGKLNGQIGGKRIAFLGNEAAVDADGHGSLDLLSGLEPLRPVCVFGLQHGYYGEKQDNMIESDDFIDPVLDIPVFSLYGKVRNPTPEMTDLFDVLLVDLQDLGVRVYTYITTLFAMIDACGDGGKEIWIFDRPNPCGRKTEGLKLQPGWESFIGAAPVIMQYGLTLGELAMWYVAEKKANVELHVVKMEGYAPEKASGYGWPVDERPWVNPSPNASGLNMARCYPGTCLIEGTTLSEGRGTTHPLEMIGAPGLGMRKILHRMEEWHPAWMQGVVIRSCHFEPVVDKHSGRLCEGVQLHTDTKRYDHFGFKPFRLVSLLLKVIRQEYPDYDLWYTGEFEYETTRPAIDLLSGSDFLRKWVDDPASGPGDLEMRLEKEETEWREKAGDFWIY